MNEQDSSRLDDYFNGLLPENDRQTMLDRSRREPDFGREFQLREEMENWLRAAPARQQFNGQLDVLRAEFFEEKRAAKPSFQVVRGRRFLLAIAASIALALAAIWFFNQPDEPVYADFANHEPLALTVRGGSPTATGEADASRFFNEKNWSAALSELEKLAAAQPDETEIEFHRAICLLELNRTGEAREQFQRLASGASAWASEARWYLALTFLKEKNGPRCLEILEQIQADDRHFGEAEKLRRGL